MNNQNQPVSQANDASDAAPVRRRAEDESERRYTNEPVTTARGVGDWLWSPATHRVWAPGAPLHLPLGHRCVPAAQS